MFCTNFFLLALDSCPARGNQNLFCQICIKMILLVLFFVVILFRQPAQRFEKLF